MNEIKICLLGGDTRQTSLSYYLSEAGYETAVWGIPFPECGGETEPFPGVKCTDPQSAVAGSRAVILPLPASQDGVRVYTNPKKHNTPELQGELRLTEVMELIKPGMLLLAGRPSEVLKTMARDANIKLIDYYDCEEVQIKNAIPTAEGAIALAMEGLPVTVYGAKTVILGYGRIGQRLATVLHAMGADVTVVARSERDRTWAAIAGCRAMELSAFLKNPGSPDVLFNTIPAPILNDTFLDMLAASTILIELASAPGCIDPTVARTCKQKIIRAASLPGKVAPTSAGKILFETILRILTESGVRPT